jgi:putative nucleotidyltransferase with HDIG domain
MLSKKVGQLLKRKNLVNYAFPGILALVIFLALVLPISLRPTPSLLNIGDVTFQDIRAPRTFSYESKILTEQARLEAEKSVQPVYLPADSSITRKQVEKLRTILNYISTVRLDSYAGSEQKVKDIQKLSDLVIDSETAQVIVELDEERWTAVLQECLVLLEQVMRNSIREDQVSSTQKNLSPQISFDFEEAESSVINEIVSQLIVANSLFSNESTLTSIEKARASVNPVTKQFISGEIIVSSGEVIDALTWEALQELGYTEPKNLLVDYMSAGLITLVVVSFGSLYVQRAKQTTGKKVQDLKIILPFFLVYLFIARLIIPNHTILPYLFPIAAFGLTISSLYDFETGLIFSIPLSLLAAYNETTTIDLAIYYLIPTAIAIFLLGRGRRITVFFVAGLAIALSGSAIVISYRLLNSFLDLSGAGTLIGAAFVNGFGSVSLTLIFQFLLAQFTGKVTALQLMDLSRPDHPLLQDLLVKAPGTYQHSLQVANLAEQAAKEINCDALLTRVGALYHDVGKLKNPLFFIENQPPAMLNAHDELDPALSAATIIKHVDDGLKLAREYHIPPQIQAFISEHHATTMTHYQYNRALGAKGDPAKVNASLYRYPGPNPKSKETALLMMADGCEARVRAEAPHSIEEIEDIVKKAVQNYLDKGYLVQTDLTMNDLRLVTTSFVKTLQNTYHQRIKYPEQDAVPPVPEKSRK